MRCYTDDDWIFQGGEPERKEIDEDDEVSRMLEYLEDKENGHFDYFEYALDQIRKYA